MYLHNVPQESTTNSRIVTRKLYLDIKDFIDKKLQNITLFSLQMRTFLFLFLTKINLFFFGNDS